MPIMARQPNGEYIEICVIPSWIGGTQHDISEIKLPTDERIFKNWRTYEGTLPVTVTHSKSGFAISYKIWGNSGGVGRKKTNLAEGEQLLRNASMSSTGEIVASSSNFAFRLIPVVAGREYSIINIYGVEASESANFYAFFEELPQIGSIAYNNSRYSFKTASRTFVAPITGFVAASDYYPMYDEQHLNLIPLEVYEGNASPYYLPIVSPITGLSEPLYAIGEHADSLDLSTGVLTRRIKKAVLTGNGIYSKDSGGEYMYWTTESALHLTYTDCFCSHLVSTRDYPRNQEGICTYRADTVTYLNFGADVMNSQTSGNTVAGVKEYLAAQYAAGTPVTLWYVLNEPETSTIPVPSGLTGVIEGYLIQDGTPTPETPIYPSANDAMLTTDIYIGREALGEDEYVDSESGKLYRWAAITGLSEPLCGIGTYTDSLDLSTGVLTRRIKKSVLTGEENFGMPGISYRVPLGFTLSEKGIANYVIGEKNSHFIINESAENSPEYTDMYTARLAAAGLVAWFFLPRSFFSGELNAENCIAEFKSYLSAQYAAGTPVTLWYVLAKPETLTIPVPSGLTGVIEGYLVQDGTPTPESPIYPTANGAKQTDGTYSIENAYITPTDPPEPLPQIPTFAGTTTISYGGTGASPEKVEFTYKLGV